MSRWGGLYALNAFLAFLLLDSLKSTKPPVWEALSVIVDAQLFWQCNVVELRD